LIISYSFLPHEVKGSPYPHFRQEVGRVSTSFLWLRMTIGLTRVNPWLIACILQLWQILQIRLILLKSTLPLWKILDNIFHRGSENFKWISSSTWNPYTLCTRFRLHLSQWVYGFQKGVPQLANPFKMHTPPVEDCV
jgi:hypothetical protein